jgi:hypothetical protein
MTAEFGRGESNPGLPATLRDSSSKESGCVAYTTPDYLACSFLRQVQLESESACIKIIKRNKTKNQNQVDLLGRGESNPRLLETRSHLISSESGGVPTPHPINVPLHSRVVK